MPRCLVAIGSNLDDRAGRLRRAVLALAVLPQSRLLARSSIHVTPPVGGPAGQDTFFNAVALLEVAMPAAKLLHELQRIEQDQGRQPGERWAPRPLDLDLLVYGDEVVRSPGLELPHPRMTYRRFVLGPAAEAAPDMVHPESGWTVAALLAHLDRGDDAIAVAAVDPRDAAALVAELAQRHGLPGAPPGAAVGPRIIPWTSDWSGCRPRLLLALRSCDGTDLRQLRTMLELPNRGPVAWIGGDLALSRVDEAAAAMASVWPSLARAGRGGA